MDGKRALRNDFQVHLPDEPYIPPDSDYEAELNKEADNINDIYATLANHQGWKLIKAEFLETIAAYRSGKTIQAAIKDGRSNAEVGELTRTSNAVADELEMIILKVETAVEQVEAKRNGRGSRSSTKGV